MRQQRTFVVRTVRQPMCGIGIIAALMLAGAGGQATAQTTGGCGVLQTMVDNTPSGGILDLPDGCVYRERVTIRKPITIIGGPGVWVKGSNVWTGFQQDASGLWASNQSVPALPVPQQSADPNNTQLCDAGYDSCGWPEQVFVDGQPFEQVDPSATPGTGEFKINASRQIIMADDPTGHTIEVATRQYWVYGDSNGNADNVTLQNINFEHAGNGSQMSALKNLPGNDAWHIEGCSFGYTSGGAVNLSKATGLVINDALISNAGQTGIGSNGADLTVSNSTVSGSNYEHYNGSFEAGGIKVSKSLRFEAYRNRLHNNDREAIWTDVEAKNISIHDNEIDHNTKFGLHIEISDNVSIYGNRIYENGWGRADASFGNAAVGVIASRDVDVHDNVLAWNNDGFIVQNTPRTQGSAFEQVRDVQIHSNDVLAKDYADGTFHLALGWTRTVPSTSCASADFYCLDEPESNNGGYSNRYYYQAPEPQQNRYKWISSNFKRLSDFNATLGEENGRYLSESEKNQVIAANSLPSSPEPR